MTQLQEWAALPSELYIVKRVEENVQGKDMR